MCLLHLTFHISSGYTYSQIHTFQYLKFECKTDQVPGAKIDNSNGMLYLAPTDSIGSRDLNPMPNPIWGLFDRDLMELGDKQMCPQMVACTSHQASCLISKIRPGPLIKMNNKISVLHYIVKGAP